MSTQATRVDEAAETPAERWDELTEDEREAADTIWDRVSGWVRNRVESEDDVGRRELDRRISTALDRMILASGMVRPTLVLAHQACQHRPDDPHEIIEQFEVRIMHFLAVLDLYRDCRIHQRWQRIPGRPGAPRTLWERRRGLDSSLARWEYAAEQMVVLGLLDERPTWGDA